jgi:hypothetical protein
MTAITPSVEAVVRRLDHTTDRADRATSKRLGYDGIGTVSACQLEAHASSDERGGSGSMIGSVSACTGR